MSGDSRPLAAATLPAGHLRQLDSLRAIAIGAVMLEHFGGGLTDYIPIGAGSLGVGLFFTLSGYLITASLFTSFGRGEDWRVAFGTFYLKRFFRLAPIYYVALTTLAMFGIPKVVDGILWHATYLSNVWVSYGGKSTIFWSLAVEQQFYLIWPLFILCVPRSRLVLACSVLFIFCILFKSYYVAAGLPLNWRLLPAAGEPLLTGCMLAAILSKRSVRNIGKKELLGFTAAAWLCIGIALIIWMRQDHMARTLWNQALCSVFFAWIVYWGIRGVSGPIGAVLDLRAVQFMGKISYGLYLVHSFVPTLLERYLGTLPLPVMGALVLAITFGICSLSWFWFERPMIRLGATLAERLRASNRASPAFPPPRQELA